MRILDSRRLTGPSLWLDRPGAILDVRTDGLDPDRAVERWRHHAGRYLAGMGWQGEQLAHRVYGRGVQLAFTAPIDLLYLATDVNEAAWVAAALDLGDAGPAAGDPGDAGAASDRAASVAAPFEVQLEQFRARVEQESQPALPALAEAAASRGLAFLSDDKRVSVGLGIGSRTWPATRMPVPERIRWRGLQDVPIALVTGTNGKTTTVRLLGAMAAAAGRVAGVTSTDRVDVGAEVVAVGDYSGPNGARTVLRDRRVELAFLEVARGGILRRGLPVRRAEAAIVTNVASDHMGEYGIFDLGALADAKLVVAKAVGAGGRVVLNADDPLLLERGMALAAPVTWFTLDAGHHKVAEHVAAGGDACVLEGDALVLRRGAERRVIAAVADVPIALGGAARHNVANALGAIGVAAAVGLPPEAIARGLTGFESTPAANPGRANRWTVNGAQVIVDYAHNPHGLAALVAMASTIDAHRRALVIGQAGDRDDQAIAEFIRVAWSLAPDHVFIKEMDSFRRGREPGVVPELIERELRRLGARDGGVSRHPTELDAVRAALAWAEPGDLLVLTVHAQREAVIELLERRASCAGRAS